MTSDDLPTTADVVIVGAGIAGLSVAYHLLLAGRSVVVVDRAELGSGQTACTSAHLVNVLDVRFSDLAKKRGEAAAWLAARSHAAAIDTIEQIARQEPIECDFRRVPGYLFAAPKHRKDFEREVETVTRLGLGTELLERAPFTGVDTRPCLRFPEQAQFHPVAYLTGLAQAIRRRGGKLVFNTAVEKITGGKFPEVQTHDGRMIQCAAVVVATATPINAGLALEMKQAPYLTYVVALPLPANSVPPALFWDTDEPFHYARIVPGSDGQGLDHLIVGGEDHRTGQADDGAERYANLEAWGRTYFPEAGPAQERWSGQVIQSMDGLGYIGHNPAAGDNVYLVGGDSGNGLTNGTLAGPLLTGLIQDGQHPWKDLYDPARATTGLLGTLAENASTLLQYLDYLTPGDVATVERIPPGGGACVRVGLTKVAIHRDAAGVLHTCSAVCPHRGGLVRWNDAEQTWDCPAHGSRFDRFGHAMVGPATADLTPVEPSPKG